MTKLHDLFNISDIGNEIFQYLDDLSIIYLYEIIENKLIDIKIIKYVNTRMRCYIREKTIEFNSKVLEVKSSVSQLYELCSDCGDQNFPKETLKCADCYGLICLRCYKTCGCCDKYLCLSCIEQCEEIDCSKDTCFSCKYICDRCKRQVCSECISIYYPYHNTEHLCFKCDYH